MKINKKLLPIKAHYFLFNAGTAPIVPFLPTLIPQFGFSTVIVGIVYTILPIASLISKPIAGAIADRFQCRKALLLVAIIGTLLSYYLVLWVPPVEFAGPVQFHCYSQANLEVNLTNTESCVVNTLPNTSSTLCELKCEAHKDLLEDICRNWGLPQYCGKLRPPAEHLKNLVIGHINKSGEDIIVQSLPPPQDALAISAPQTLSFKAHINLVHTISSGNALFLRVDKIQVHPPDWITNVSCSKLEKANCTAVCDMPQVQNLIKTNNEIPNSAVTGLYQFWLLLLCYITGWVSMAVAVSVGDTICFELLGDEGHKYGFQRLWGSVGWGIFSFIAGYLVDVYSSCLPIKDYSPAIYLMIALLGFNVLSSSSIKYTQMTKSPSILKDMRTVLGDLRVLVFLVWCFTIGLFTAVIWNFLLNFLEVLAKQYGGEGRWIKTLQGLVMAVQCFGGELPFFFLSGWILKKIGHVHAMTLVLFTFGLRMTLYSFLENPWYTLPIELLNGFTFGLFYATMANYAFVVAPPGSETTVQGLVGAVFEGVGVSTGSFIAGFLFQNLPGSTVFLIFGIFGASASVVHFIVQLLISKYYSPGRDNKERVPLLNGSDYSTAKYASPNDAIHILEERSSSSPS